MTVELARDDLLRGGLNRRGHIFRNVTHADIDLGGGELDLPKCPDEGT